MNFTVLNVIDTSLIWRLWKCCSNEHCWVSEIITDIMSEKADEEDNKDVWDVEVKTFSEIKEITDVISWTHTKVLWSSCWLRP